MVRYPFNSSCLSLVHKQAMSNTYFLAPSFFQRLCLPRAIRHNHHYPRQAPTVRHTRRLPPFLNRAPPAQLQNIPAPHLPAALKPQPQSCAMTLRPAHQRPRTCTFRTAPYPCRPQIPILHTQSQQQSPMPQLTTIAPRPCAGTRIALARGRRPVSARPQPTPCWSSPRRTRARHPVPLPGYTRATAGSK